MIRVVGLDALQAVVEHDGAYDAVRGAMLALAAGEVNAPEELALLLEPSGDIHVKGAHLEGSRWIVFKVATGSFPGAPNSGCSFLLDAATGEPKLILDDGGWLTEMRTAAAGALAADLLAVAGPVRVAVLGTGVQARFQLDALGRRRRLEEIRVWGRTLTKAEELARAYAARSFAEVADAVDGVDMIITATSATEPVLTVDQVSAGVHITAMGADTVGKNELDPAILRRADVVVADDIATCSRVGELQHAPDVVSEALWLAELVAETAPGRRTPDDITVADLCGIGTYDAAIAGLAADGLGAADAPTASPEPTPCPDGES